MSVTSVTTLFGSAERHELDDTELARALSARPDHRTVADDTDRTQHAGPDLAGIVRRVAATPSLWKKHARLNGADRSWTKIAVPEDVDVWVIVWGSSSSTELHDHGAAAAAFTTVRGELTEIRPDARGRLLPRKFAPGVIATVEPGEIHDVTNERSRTAVSIHAYAPRLESMTFYTRTADGLVIPDRVVPTTLPELP